MSTMPDLKQNKLLSTIVHSLHRHHMTIAAHPGHSGINEFQSRKYKLVYPLTLLLIREAASTYSVTEALEIHTRVHCSVQRVVARQRTLEEHLHVTKYQSIEWRWPVVRTISRHSVYCTMLELLQMARLCCLNSVLLRFTAASLAWLSGTPYLTEDSIYPTQIWRPESKEAFDNLPASCQWVKCGVWVMLRCNHCRRQGYVLCNAGLWVPTCHHAFTV